MLKTGGLRAPMLHAGCRAKKKALDYFALNLFAVW